MRLPVTPDPSEECFRYLRNRLRSSLSKERNGAAICISKGVLQEEIFEQGCLTKTNRRNE
ncbi:unnamed protein product, partial [Larinioides sclopetarius]